MRRVIWLALAAVLIALPSAAVDNVIYKGIDLFYTPEDGSSFMDFSNRPIPAGFFCAGSEPFTGTITWKGVPVATAIPGELGRADTIVQRLDDAVFNKRGIATTRVRFAAVQMESTTAIKTGCGDYKVRVVLDGPQPITRMRIVRDAKNGGRFLAWLALRAKFVFTPVSGSGKQLELPPHFIRFPVNPRFPWAFPNTTGALEKRGTVVVDTNFDSQPDTILPGTSNFAAGWDGSGSKSVPLGGCHSHEEHDHCVGVIGGASDGQ